jgi:hypothetical protein
MELTVKVKNAQNAEVLSRFLKSIQYVEDVEIGANGGKIGLGEFAQGNFAPNQKPSDFAGIWKGKKRNAKTLRWKAWARKK